MFKCGDYLPIKDRCFSHCSLFLIKLENEEKGKRERKRKEGKRKERNYDSEEGCFNCMFTYFIYHIDRNDLYYCKYLFGNLKLERYTRIRAGHIIKYCIICVHFHVCIQTPVSKFCSKYRCIGIQSHFVVAIA